MKGDDVDVEKSDLDVAKLRVMAPSATSVEEMKLSTDNDLKRGSTMPDDDRTDTDNEFEVLALRSDGGWGWVVTIASFFSNMIVDGVCYTFGLLYAELLEEFQAGRSKTALVGSLLVGTYLMIGQSHAAVDVVLSLVPRCSLLLSTDLISSLQAHCTLIRV